MGRSPITSRLIALLTLSCSGCQVAAQVSTICQCQRENGSPSPSRCYECPCNGDDQCQQREDGLSCILSEDKDSTPCKKVLMDSCTLMNSCPDRVPRSTVCECERNTSRCYQCNVTCNTNSRRQCPMRAMLRCILTEDSNSNTCKTLLDMLYNCTQQTTCEEEEDEQEPNPIPGDPRPPPRGTRPPRPPQPQPPPRNQPPLPTDPQPPPPSDSQPPPSKFSQATLIGILVPVVICVTVIIIVIAVAISLAMYWKFRIKVIQERNGTTQPANSYTLNSYPNQQTQEEPLYSEVQTTAYIKPPQLPPSRVPYYKEIDCDGIDKVSDYEQPRSKVEYEQPRAHCEQLEDKLADNGQLREMAADYEQPITRLNKNSNAKNNDIIIGQHNNDMTVNMIEPYQDPADALQRQV